MYVHRGAFVFVAMSPANVSPVWTGLFARVVRARRPCGALSRAIRSRDPSICPSPTHPRHEEYPNV